MVFMKINKLIQFITLPRSGHHLLIRMLNVLSKLEGLNLENEYCEFYNCCKTFPCIHNKRVHKNHDLKLVNKISLKVQYIVQVRRDKEKQLKSIYNFIERLHENHPRKQEIKGGYVQFLNSSLGISYIENFQKKYFSISNNKIVYYEDILEHTDKVLIDIFKTLYEFAPKNLNIDKVISETDIKR